MSQIDFSKFFKLLSQSDMTSDQQSLFGRQISNMSDSIISDKIGPNISNPYQIEGTPIGINGSFDGGNYWQLRSNMPEEKNSGGYITLTEDLGLVSGGFNISGMVRPSLRFSDFKNIWTYRTYTTKLYGFADCASFSLTANYGVLASGYNNSSGPTYIGTTERYSDSENLWTSRTSLAMSRSRARPASFSLNSDYSIMAGGSNLYSTFPPPPVGTSYLNYVDRYTNSSNIWASLPNISGGSTSVGFSSTTYNSDNGGMAGTESAGYYYGYNTLFTHSSLIWASRTLMPIASAGSVGLSFGYLSVYVGGYNGPSLYDSQEYNLSNNSWRSVISSNSLKAGGVSLSSSREESIIAGPQDHTEKFKNMLSSILYNQSTSGIYNSISSFGVKYDMTCPIPAKKKTNIITNTLKTERDKINSILVSAIIEKEDEIPNSSYGVSLDDGQTWKDGIGFDIPTEITGLKPSDDGTYNLKLKFNLFSNPISNTWNSKTDSPNYGRAFGAGFSLTPDVCLVSGGYNSSTQSNICESISDSLNSWTSKTNQPFSGISYPMGISLSNDIGILAGGHNGTQSLNTTSSFSNSANTWNSKANLTGKKRNGCATLSLTTNIGILAGGWNGGVTDYLNYIDVYNYNSNTWTNINSMKSLAQVCGISLTTNLGMISGGENGSYISTSYNTEFKYAENTLLDKAPIPYIVHGFASYSLTSDIGIINAGANGSTWGQGPINNIKYSHSSNSWTSLTSIPSMRDEPSGVTIDSYSGLTIFGAVSSSFTNTCFKYTLSETDFLGFYCLTS